MPDADGNLRGISLSGRAGEAWERIFGPLRDPFFFEREAVREAIEAGATDVRVEAGSLRPSS